MVTVMLVLGLAAAVAADIVLRRRLAAAQSALDAALSRPPTPAPPRLAESRRERFGLVWFPTLPVDDGAGLVMGIRITSSVPSTVTFIDQLRWLRCSTGVYLSFSK